MTIISLDGPAFSVDISTRGAEMVRLYDHRGGEWLWDGDPAVWTGRAPLLFPMVGRALNDRIRVGGEHYPLPQHGFARLSEFALDDRDAQSCRLSLGASDATLAQFPFSFRLVVAYRLTENQLEIAASVINDGDAVLPVSFGFHPAFRWPLPHGAKREEHRLIFERAEPAPVRRLQDGYLSPTLFETPVVDRRLALSDALFTDGAIIFDAARSRRVTYGVPNGASIDVSYPHMPQLGLWTKPGAGFLCVEPWQGYACPQGFDDEFARRPGVDCIASGESSDYRMAIGLNF